MDKGGRQQLQIISHFFQQQKKSEYNPDNKKHERGNGQFFQGKGEGGVLPPEK